MGTNPERRKPLSKTSPHSVSGRIISNDAIQASQDANNRALRQLPHYPLGVPTDIIMSDYTANINDAVRVDPTNGAITISLPEIEESMVGNMIFVVNISSSTNTIIIKGQDEINGNVETTLTTAYDWVRLVATKSNLWIEI